MDRICSMAIISGMLNQSDFQAAPSNSTNDGVSLRGYINAAFMLLFFTMGLPWNSLVIGIILKKKLFTRPSVMLLLNLAVNHLLVCLSIMPLTFLLGIGNDSIHNERDNICLTGSLFVLLSSVSIHTVTLMSVDRVIYLWKPLRYRHIVTPRKMFIAILVVWVFSFALSLPPMFGFGEVGYNPDLATCGVIFRAYGPYSTLLTILAAISHMVKFASVGCILYIIRKHLLKKLRRAIVPRNDSSTLSLEGDKGATANGGPAENVVLKKYKRNQLQLVKVFGVIFSISMVTVLPTLAAAVLVLTFGDESAVPVVYGYWIAYILVVSKSVIYPIIESSMTREIRDALSKLCSVCSRKEKTLCVPTKEFVIPPSL